MTEEEEAAYVKGGQAVWGRLRAEAVRELDLPHSDDRNALALFDTRQALRRLCKELSLSNDWPDDLYLYDVVEKHILPALRPRLATPRLQDYTVWLSASPIEGHIMSVDSRLPPIQAENPASAVELVTLDVTNGSSEGVATFFAWVAPNHRFSVTVETGARFPDRPGRLRTATATRISP